MDATIARAIPKTFNAAATRKNSSTFKAEERPKNVVLIGSTGHGKSTFGNFLVSSGENEQFTTSDLMEPCTKGVNLVQVSPYAKFPPLNVIDTPGTSLSNFQSTTWLVSCFCNFCIRS